MLKISKSPFNIDIISSTPWLHLYFALLDFLLINCKIHKHTNNYINNYLNEKEIERKNNAKNDEILL